MARVSISKEQWRIARIQWEGDPLVSYADIAEQLTTSRQAVKQHADRNGWQKKIDAAAVAEKAHIAADAKVSYVPVGTPEQAPSVYVETAENVDLSRAPMRPALPTPVPAGTDSQTASVMVEQGAVDMRAQVLAQHRTEWKAVRSKLYKLLKAGDSMPDGDTARAVKAVAESVKVLQEGERKAYGLEAPGDPRNPGAGRPAIVINRTKGKTIGR
ncbi:hypothetical protein [Pararobbsia silviterrae]|uniref:Uncharacterized protein n=1 Tax=Pararobbsia silviterrae TaxID=1792498 RepID=A0A494X311_9BURK|nr:hypothetical protein [Pararobbsia silviterrae]RKP44740.1 hypothetical protein D7S86_27345 [Pararobbsia silviterrae]